MARYVVNRKFQILRQKVNKHPIHDPQLRQHRVRFSATVLWLFQACPGIDSFNAAWVEPLIPSSFPFLLSLLQYMPCLQPLVPRNTYILLDILLCSIAEYLYELCVFWRPRRASQNTNNE